MTKTITSTIPEFPGTITLSSPLNLSQGYHIAVALETASAADDSRAHKSYATNTAILQALAVCSEGWDIAGQPEKPTVETFVASPAQPANRLLSWAFSQLTDIYFGERKVPNE